MVKPAIVAPGGSLEKALIALHFGADAVYVGARQFSLRKSATNLSNNELRHLCEHAHGMNKRVYLALNSFPHHTDTPAIIAFLNQIRDIPLDACICADIGMVALIQAHTPFAIHASTQASISNAYSAAYWKSIGASRIVMARELSIAEAGEIKKQVGISVEQFIHGAMCSSFSGKCTISNVTAGRDSNRGGCVQSCRHQYTLANNGEAYHIMNSKDLMGLHHIPDYFHHHIDAVKIEGRMKSALYVANACHQYRMAIDAYAQNPDAFNPTIYSDPLTQVSNRGFTSASLDSPAGADSIDTDWNGYTQSWDFMGIVTQCYGDRSVLTTKQPLSATDSLWALSPNTPAMTPITPSIESMTGDRLDHVAPNRAVWLNDAIPAFSIIIRK